MTGFLATQVASTDGLGRFELPSVGRWVGAFLLGFDTGDAVPTLALHRADVPTEPLDVDLSAWPLSTLRLQAGAVLSPTASRFLLWSADPEHGGDPVVLVANAAASPARGPRLEPEEWFVVATAGEGLAALCLSVSPGPNAGYVQHDFARTLVLPTFPGAFPAWLQWIVFGTGANTWPGGVSEAMRVYLW